MFCRLILCWIQELLAQSLITEILGIFSATAPNYCTKSTEVTKTYFRQTVPMIG